MDPRTVTMRAELGQFRKTELYKHLREQWEATLKLRIVNLVDAALQSTDIRLVRIAQAVRQDALLWREIEYIDDVSDTPAEQESTGPQKRFRDLEFPDLVEVGGGYT